MTIAFGPAGNEEREASETSATDRIHVLDFIQYGCIDTQRL